ncbi:MAG: Na(+)/H(+) antiporter subunit D [Proteobacteria bacterium]|nr:Na(+)/H(+) antiporter subunit D [Pseudomonadota bacterium]
MIAIEALPPGVTFIAGALAIPLLRGVVQKVWILVLPLLVLGLVWGVPDGAPAHVSFLDYTLIPVNGDALSRLFAIIFSIMAFAGGLYALNHCGTIEITAAFIYAGSAIGVAFAGDMLTLFLFWEAMALGSTTVLLIASTPQALKAAMRYLSVHVLGGSLLLVGIIAHFNSTGDMTFAAMKADSFATWMILLGFLINAAAVPFSAWLPDAYPEASPGGMVFLSAFTTKTAVYVLIRGFPGTEFLVFIGLGMVFYGIIYALLENDMRRILAYSIVNQVGFMITGIGIGTELAINGAAAHAFTHIIYKALLLMSAGSVLLMTGKRKCSDLGGLFRSMPLTTVCGIIGALSISSFPLTSGFISKSMISQAAADETLTTIWFLLAAASAGVFLHAGIKFPWFVFFQKDSGLRPPDPPLNMRLAMVLFAALCIGIGVFPGPLYALLPFPVDFVPYKAAKVLTTLQLLLFSGLAFFLCLPLMKRTQTISLDLDWFYRRALPWAVEALVRVFGPVDRAIRVGFVGWLEKCVRVAFQYTGPRGVLARTTTAGGMVFWAVAALAIYLVLYLT